MRIFGNIWKMKLILFIVAIHIVDISGLENGLARTPPMGWMHWQRFRCLVDCENYPDDCVTENLFRNMADLMVSEGYLDVGYEYIIVDDCWLSKERDNNSRLQADPERFPSGIKALADYVHSKGLKFGLYEDFGTKTCAGYPGVLDHLEIDAQTFADWDVDYVKLDACYSKGQNLEEGYIKFGKLLNKTGRPMVYSCSWPAYEEPLGIKSNYRALAEHCNLWRNWDDIEDIWSNVTNILKWFSDNQDRIAPYAGPGHWNDPDMLIIGNFALSYEQSRSQMALWSILAAPLIMSNDLRNIRPEFKEILLNRDAIAINQDLLGIQGKLIVTKEKIEIWTKPVLPASREDHSYAIAFFSKRFDGYPYKLTVTLRELGLNSTAGYKISDIFHELPLKILSIDEKLDVRVKPSGVVFLKATLVKDEEYDVIST